MAVLPLLAVVCGVVAAVVVVDVDDAVGSPCGVPGTAGGVKMITGRSSTSSSSGGNTLGVDSFMPGERVGGTPGSAGPGTGGVTDSHKPSFVVVVVLKLLFARTSGVAKVAVVVVTAVEVAAADLVDDDVEVDVEVDVDVDVVVVNKVDVVTVMRVVDVRVVIVRVDVLVVVVGGVVVFTVHTVAYPVQQSCHLKQSAEQ